MSEASDDRAIRSIAIAGGGIVGLSAALAFARSLPRTKVTLVETPSDPAALADRMPTAWPTVGRFHAAAGLDELDLVRDGIAAHHLGTIVEGWSEDDGSWVHAFAPHGKPVGPVQFDQIWLRAKLASRAGSYDAYSTGAALARAGKFVHPSGDPDSLLSRFGYGLRLDPDRYRDRLLDHAGRANARSITTDITGVELGADGIRELQLASGERIEADLFVDCTGPSGRLVSAVDESFEEWPSHQTRSLFIERLAKAALQPATRIARTETGWTGEWPLRDGVIRCEAGRELDRPEAVPIRPGRRTRPWARNVLALGDAATAVDPLHGLNLDLAHRAILLALDLLPGRDFSPLELAEYNRRSAIMTDQVRDFIALHYAPSGKTELPESFARRLDQYQHRGRLPFQEDEVINRDDWTAALIGLGFIPRNVDPAAAGVPIDRAIEAMNRIADELASTVGRLPDYDAYLTRIAVSR